MGRPLDGSVPVQCACHLSWSPKELVGNWLKKEWHRVVLAVLLWMFLPKGCSQIEVCCSGLGHLEVSSNY